LGGFFGPAKLCWAGKTLEKSTDKKIAVGICNSGNANTIPSAMPAMIEFTRAGDIIQAIFEMPSPALHIPGWPARKLCSDFGTSKSASYLHLVRSLGNQEERGGSATI
jgi:hypothetical protein